MVCYKPLKAFPIGLTDNNKTKYKITSYEVDHVEIHDNNKIKESYDKSVSPYSRKAIYDWQEIPCGQCRGCRLEYSRQWADRCLLEMKQHKESFFVTLTYNDEHIPLHEYVDKNTGVVGEVASLEKRDFQLFMKRLRKNYTFDNKLRFFAAGEYGDQTFRPHYHAIIFGLHLDDLIWYKRTPLGFDYYKSPFLERCWSVERKDSFGNSILDDEGKKIYDPIGMVVVAPASWKTCAYTARYIMKKQKGQAAKMYEDYNFQPEFTLMSRKPGIARQYFDENIEKIFSQDCVYVPVVDGSHAIFPNDYFKRLFKDMDEEGFLKYKELKELCVEDLKQAKLKQTSESYLQMLSTEESALESKLHRLKRISV